MIIDFCCEDMANVMSEGHIKIFANTVFTPALKWKAYVWIVGTVSAISHCPYCSADVIISLKKASGGDE